MKRKLRVTACLIAMSVLCTGMMLGQDEKEQSREQALVDLANQARAEGGLKPLIWDQGLAAAAKAHAERMAQEGELSHRYGGEPDLPQRAHSSVAQWQSIRLLTEGL
jgi:uncharacterized protein YkwD